MLCTGLFLIGLRLRSLTFFFFFSSRRRHTRCSRDWSSDVCSSDLALRSRGHEVQRGWYYTPSLGSEAKLSKHMGLVNAIGIDPQTGERIGVTDPRSEERRVGKECRSRWSPYH